jgi:hypothetical protein
LWANESFGDFDQAINIVIGKLRNVLGDSVEKPRQRTTVRCGRSAAMLPSVRMRR